MEGTKEARKRKDGLFRAVLGDGAAERGNSSLQREDARSPQTNTLPVIAAEKPLLPPICTGESALNSFRIFEEKSGTEVKIFQMASKCTFSMEEQDVSLSKRDEMLAKCTHAFLTLVNKFQMCSTMRTVKPWATLQGKSCILLKLSFSFHLTLSSGCVCVGACVRERRRFKDLRTAG